MTTVVQVLRGRWLVVTLALALLVGVLVTADPREMESEEFKEEFGDEYEERAAPAGDLHKRIEFEIEHNVPLAGAGGFSQRGKVEIVYSANAVKPKVSFVGLPALSGEQIAHMEGLLRKNKHYTIRARSDPADPSSPYVMTSIPMCVLAGTRLREDVTFHLSATGKLLAMEYLTPYVTASSCAEYQKVCMHALWIMATLGDLCVRHDLQRDLKTVKFSSNGNAIKAQNGPTPPKQITVKKDRAPQGVQPIKTEDDKSAEENQSFLRKYWYIILPIVLFSVFGTEPAPAPGAPGAPGGGAAPGAGGGGPRRR
ncbi:TPA: hypothetical protein N0F65_006697 [Lagenidium giganteum]|uniref:ER membrane protein complex subunit 10 n=1 Tax=Lagenidium giganteum TaxID=4803 RepID=A0AAV2Z9A3_9STRA|nr:TPA: hypothetical protein N0F65_006697 [Lagenidium giganteum]